MNILLIGYRGTGKTSTAIVLAKRLERPWLDADVELERRAWGVFSTDFYPTYDFVPVRERLTRESDERKGRR